MAGLHRSTLPPNSREYPYTVKFDPALFFPNPTNSLEGADQTKPLVLAPGKHTIRGSRMIYPGKVDEPSDAPFKVISNPVEVEISAASK